MTIGDVTRDIAICAVSYINVYCSKLKCLKMGIYWYTWRHTRSVNCIRFSPDSFLWKNWILWLLIYNCIFSLSFHLTEKMWLYLKKSKKKTKLAKATYLGLVTVLMKMVNCYSFFSHTYISILLTTIYLIHIHLIPIKYQRRVYVVNLVLISYNDTVKKSKFLTMFF